MQIHKEVNQRDKPKVIKVDKPEVYKLDEPKATVVTMADELEAKVDEAEPASK